MSGGKRKSKGKERMTNIFTLLVPQGEYVEGGGLMGFAYGYFLKKILKAAILILEGHGGIYRNERVVDTTLANFEMQTNAWIEQSIEQLVHFLNNTVTHDNIEDRVPPLLWPSFLKERPVPVL